MAKKDELAVVLWRALAKDNCILVAVWKARKRSRRHRHIKTYGASGRHINEGFLDFFYIFCKMSVRLSVYLLLLHCLENLVHGACTLQSISNVRHKHILRPKLKIKLRCWTLVIVCPPRIFCARKGAFPCLKICIFEDTSCGERFCMVSMISNGGDGRLNIYSRKKFQVQRVWRKKTRIPMQDWWGRETACDNDLKTYSLACNHDLEAVEVAQRSLHVLLSDVLCPWGSSPLVLSKSWDI